MGYIHDKSYKKYIQTLNAKKNNLNSNKKQMIKNNLDLKNNIEKHLKNTFNIRKLIYITLIMLFCNNLLSLSLILIGL